MVQINKIYNENSTTNYNIFNFVVCFFQLNY